MLSSAGIPTDWLRKRALLTPFAPAAQIDAVEMPWKDLDARADRMASALVDLGVLGGDRVGVLLPNGLSFVEAVHAVPRAGAILVPLNVRLAAPEIAWQVNDAGLRVVLYDDATASLAKDAMALSNAAPVHVAALRDVAARPLQPCDNDLNRPHSIIYTSGTTGRPKGAILTFGNHFWSAIGSMLNLGFEPSDRLLACLPMFHVGGLAVLLRSVIYGNAAIVQASFDPQRVNAAIDGGATVVSVVSSMLARMLEERSAAPYPPTLRAVLLGGGPAPRPLLEACASLGMPVVQTYGLTEAASQVTTLAPADALRKLGSAGKALFPTDLRIAGETEEALPAQAGEILIRGATVSPGYWRHAEESLASVRDGWFPTGDIGYVDAEGFLFVLDRRDDLIVSGGENIYPAEVEAVLLAHPNVIEAGVYGIPDDRWGSVPAASVVARVGAPLHGRELIAYCRERLAKYKVPVVVDIVEALPRTAAGKLQRRLLRNE